MKIKLNHAKNEIETELMYIIKKTPLFNWILYYFIKHNSYSNVSIKLCHLQVNKKLTEWHIYLQAKFR